VSVDGSDVLDSPSVRGGISVTSHLDLGLGTWHHVLLGDAEVLAANVVVSIEVLGGNPVCDGSSEGVSNWVEVPLKLGISHLTDFATGLAEVFSSSLVLNGSVTILVPLLSEIELLLVVDDGNAFLLSEDHVVGGLVGFLKMEPEVSAWLHGGGSWLSM